MTIVCRSGGLVRRKSVFALAALCALAGCGSGAGQAAQAGSTSSPLAKQLESMPADQRAEYARTHMDEIRKEAGAMPPAHLK